MENVVFGVFLGFLVSSWCLVHMGSTGLAGLAVVYMPFGRRSFWSLPL